MILLVNLETTNGIVRSSSILRISIIRILSVVILSSYLRGFGVCLRRFLKQQTCAKDINYDAK